MLAPPPPRTHIHGEDTKERAAMQLKTQEKRRFYEEGYLVIEGAVPPIMVDAARHVINHSLGSEGMNKDDLPILRAQSYCRDAQRHPAVTDLFNRTPVLPIVESMLGAGNVNPAGGAQIALRFPGPIYGAPGEPRGHLDGLGTGTNGMEKGVYRRGFTCLAVFYLADVPAPYSGNFTVWPKSHRFFEGYFRQNGHQMLAEGMPRVDLPEPALQITARAGDVVLAHHQLVHTAAPNASSNVRYAAIFRVRHKECEQVGLDAYTDIWREWPGVREAMEGLN
jgi:hypothetical protein